MSIEKLNKADHAYLGGQWAKVVSLRIYDQITATDGLREINYAMIEGDKMDTIIMRALTYRNYRA